MASRGTSSVSSSSSFEVEGWQLKAKAPCVESWLYCSNGCHHDRYIAVDEHGAHVNDDVLWDEKERDVSSSSSLPIPLPSSVSSSVSSASDALVISTEAFMNSLRAIGLLALPSVYRYDRVEENRLEKRDKKAAKEARAAAAIVPKGEIAKKYNKWTPDSRSVASSSLPPPLPITLHHT
jgi:hypothetical protein